MRPIPEAQVDLVRELSARYRDPKAIGISDLNRPDYGDPVASYPKEIPVLLGLV